MTYTYTPLEDFVKNLYHELSIFVPTAIDMLYIADQLNIRVHFYDGGSTAIDHNGTIRIFIDNKLSSKEQWQDFGHELCHILKHKGNQLYLSTLLSTDFIKLQESQAENFMYQFCVPTFMLLNYQVHDYLEVKDAICYISDVFHVTEAFAAERLKRFRNQLQQAKWDEQLRSLLTPQPSPKEYSEETKLLLNQLYTQLNKRKVV